MMASHVQLHWTIEWRPIRIHPQRDGITSFQLKHTDSVGAGGFALPFHWWCYQADQSIIHTNLNSSFGLEVELCLDVVPSSLRYYQFSVAVFHITFKMAKRVLCCSVFDHYKVNQNLLNKGLSRGRGEAAGAPNNLVNTYFTIKVEQ